jgi:pimeloyl-ACP methyl ester carboxylesterase
VKPSRSLFLTIRGRRAHLRCWGRDDAPLLVFLHGWGDVSASWQFVVDHLQRDWRIAAPDWRGFGLSQGNGDAYWFPDYLADLDALLDELSPAQSVRLVAHSLGGNLACLYAGVRPERVERLVNLEGTGLPRHTPDEAPGRYAKWLDQLRAHRRGDPVSFRTYPDRSQFAARLQKENPRLTDDRAAFLALHLAEESLGASNEAEFRLAADPAHRWVNPILYRVEEAMACWRLITAPVLWVTGRDSFLFREFFAADSEDYRSRINCFRDVREVMVEDSGHNLHHDQPAEVARLIEEFMQ